MKHVYGIAMLACAATLLNSAPAAAQDLVGRYEVAGQNPSGSTYSGIATIRGTSGGRCEIRWTLRNTPPSEGFCMRQGDVIAAGYRLGATIGLVVYRLGPDGVLNGTWSIAGQEGVGQERLTPAR